MRLIYTFCAAAFVHLAVASATIPHLPSRIHAPPAPRVTTNPVDCIEFAKFIGIHDGTFSFGTAGCAAITHACLKENGTSIWSHQACVASATCQGTESVIILNQCQNPNVLAASAIPNLSFAIWTNIVGSCATSGCPMTQQNYIDFVYGAMSAANVTVWPNSVDDVIKNYWDPILAWTATGDTIPYTNFNDWLHWSNS
ncbi:hypothetical protein B0H13DRAFT_2416777 [Mycena leptocephala]|nr:hypothetical protein B0H13DRAFT_2416777 [Mycena leptocephala]